MSIDHAPGKLEVLDGRRISVTLPSKAGSGFDSHCVAIAHDSAGRLDAQANARRLAALYYQELEALHTFVDLHTYQVNQLGRREFMRAITSAAQQVRKDGHVPTLATSVEQLQGVAV